MTIAEAQIKATKAFVFEFPHGSGGLEQSLAPVAASEACAVVMRSGALQRVEVEDLAGSDSRLHMT